MGIFSDKTLSESQANTLNNLLPKSFHKGEWKESDFKGSNCLFNRFELNLRSLSSAHSSNIKKLDEMRKSLDEVVAKNIKIFNTEPFEAELFGMVDIGIVEKFGAASTGDRFSNGAIGYAIESALDDTWAKNNFQENAVNKVKLKLLEKAIHIYPECNLFFKFQVDFREIGSSGNVFIYMRGTAAKGKNDVLNKAKEEAENEIYELEKRLIEEKEELQQMHETKKRIPQTPKEIKEFLGE